MVSRSGGPIGAPVEDLEIIVTRTGGSGAAPGHCPPILVADDDAGVRRFLSAILGSQFTVIAVTDGAAALGAIDAAPQLHAVVSDYSMPGVNGLEVLRRARGRFPAAKLVLMSGDLPEAAREAATQMGATVRVKPLDGAALKSLLWGDACPAT